MKERSAKFLAFFGKIRQWYLFPATVFIFGIGSLSLFLLSHYLSDRQYQDSLIIDAAMDIEIDTSLAHFLIEAASDANAGMDIRKINEFIDEAIYIADSMLNGGETEHGRIREPLDDPEIRVYAESIRQNLVIFKAQAPKHLKTDEQSAINQSVDREINTIVIKIIRDAEKIDSLIGENKEREWEEYRQVFVEVIVFWIIVIAAATVGSINLARRKKKADERLKESEGNLRTLFDSAVDGIFILDMQGGFVEANRTAYERLGYTKEEMISMHVSELDPPEFALRVPERLAQIRKFGQATFESAHYRKDRSIMPVEVNSRMLEYKGETVYYSIIRDITEHKKSQNERERLHAELLEKNKELQQVVYTVSHDLRSPLINIQGYSRMLVLYLEKIISAFRDESAAKEDREKASSIINKDIPEAVGYINGGIKKMDSMLSALLQLSRSARAELKIEAIDMNRLVSDVINALDFQIKAAGAAVEVSPLPSCAGDDSQINQVFSNLIGNAVKFLSPERPGAITISGAKEEGRTVYCVGDNGIGIAPEDRERIFEMFERLHPEEGMGEGLGLTIVSKIIEKHGGRIWVESEPGKGSRFYFALPCRKGLILQ